MWLDPLWLDPNDEKGERADLSDVDLSDVDLRSANLRSANLSGADFSGANLNDANLRFVDLSDADLRSANLSGADFNGADLSSANLRSANLSGANFKFANLRFTNLSNAKIFQSDIDKHKALKPYQDELNIIKEESPYIPSSNISAETAFKEAVGLVKHSHQLIQFWVTRHALIHTGLIAIVGFVSTWETQTLPGLANWLLFSIPILGILFSLLFTYITLNEAAWHRRHLWFIQKTEGKRTEEEENEKRDPQYWLFDEERLQLAWIGLKWIWKWPWKWRWKRSWKWLWKWWPWERKNECVEKNELILLRCSLRSKDWVYALFGSIIIATWGLFFVYIVICHSPWGDPTATCHPKKDLIKIGQKTSN